MAKRSTDTIEKPAKKASSSRPRRTTASKLKTSPVRKNSAEDRSFSSAEEPMRQQMIAEAAYYISERKGFRPEYDEENWREAENEIEQRFAQLFRA